MVAYLSLIWLLALSHFALVQGGGVSLSAQTGYDEIYEAGSPIPLTITVRNDGPPLEGEIRAVVPSGGNDLVYSAPVSLPTGADKRVPLVIHNSAFGSRVKVQLISEGQVVAETDTNALRTVSREELFYGVVSADPGGLAFLETITGGRTDAAVAFLNPADLPDVSIAWSGLDVLILDDTDTSRLTPAQSSALRAWVESGGQLVVTGGPGGPATAAGVADLLPVAVGGTQTVDDLASLGEFTGEPVGAGPFVVTQGELVNGEALVEENGLPLLARREIGRGSVYFLALDPKSPPLTERALSSELWTAIAEGVPALPPWASGVQDGYGATQAVSSIPGLSLPSIWQLILFLFIYTAIIGPINYLVLRRLNRRELGWVTIPALVLLFSAATFIAGFRSRGNNPTLNVMTVAFGSANAERLRSQSIVGLYSPRRNRYDVALPYQATTFPFQEAFGTLMGGDNVATIERTGEVALRDVRTDTGEVATFIVEEHQARPPIEATAVLSPEKRTVTVTVRNNSEYTLEDAVIIHGQDQAAVGDVPAGGEQTVVISLTPGSSAVPTPDPMFPSGFVITNPLVNDPSLILGTADYYNDPVAYPRWQLIQSSYMGDTTGLNALPAADDLVTLAGFLPYSDQAVSVSGNPANQYGTTLMLLEIPTQ